MLPPVHIDSKEAPGAPELTSPVPPGGFQIRFDGRPTGNPGRLIDTEDLSGNSIAIGRWKRHGGDWLLIFEPGQ